MNQSEKTFEQIFLKELEPTLLSLSYNRSQLPRGWIYPTFLFKHSTSNVWFGCSWDWRDFYYDADLGELYLFKDVLPRVVVIGYDLTGTVKTNIIVDYLTEQMRVTREKIMSLTNNNFDIYMTSVEDTKNEKIKKMNNYVGREIKDTKELPFI